MLYLWGRTVFAFMSNYEEVNVYRIINIYNWKPFRQPLVATFPIREGKWFSSTCKRAMDLLAEGDLRNIIFVGANSVRLYKQLRRSKYAQNNINIYNWKPFRQPLVATFPIREGKWFSSTCKRAMDLLAEGDLRNIIFVGANSVRLYKQLRRSKCL